MRPTKTSRLPRLGALRALCVTAAFGAAVLTIPTPSHGQTLPQLCICVHEFSDTTTWISTRLCPSGSGCCCKVIDDDGDGLEDRVLAICGPCDDDELPPPDPD